MAIQDVYPRPRYPRDWNLNALGLLSTAKCLGKICGLAALALLLTANFLRAETNSWIKPGDGLWQETNSWSLGILPDNSQFVRIGNITNDSEITVRISSETAKNYPQSLAIAGLGIIKTNALLLDNVGTDVPLTVTNGLEIFGASSNRPATLINLQSGLIVENGALKIINGQIIQSGGYIRATNGPTYLGGHFYLMSGLFEAGAVSFGFDPNGFFQTGFFDQYGGIANVSNLFLGSTIPGNTYSIYDGELRVFNSLAVGGSVRDAHFYQYGGRVVVGGLNIGSHDSGNEYILYDGELVVTGRLSIRGDYGPENFVQEGGTNYTSELEINPLDNFPKYTLNDGLLCTGNASLTTGYNEAYFIQNGGIHIVTNALKLFGYRNRYSRDSAWYYLFNGFLSARTIQLESSVLVVSNATASISGDLQLSAVFDQSLFSIVEIFSGTLSCANSTYAGAGSDILQSGGNLIITNLFSFGGRNQWYGARFAQYDFSGGTLTASNIDLAAEMIIGSSTQIGRITNSGYFKMSGTLTSGDATEQLGRFILASNAVINLGDGDAKLTFANSSAEAWDGSAKLFVTNWNGSLSGGGDDQLKFGTDGNGLTESQLREIRFENPAGFPPGEYFAQILSSGEVVPKSGPTLSFVNSGKQFVLSWPENFSLQTATNVNGPYEDLPRATAPYTNDFADSPERYFRLRE